MFCRQDVYSSSYTSKYSLRKLQLQLSMTRSFLSLQVFTSRGKNKHSTLYIMYVHALWDLLLIHADTGYRILTPIKRDLCKCDNQMHVHLYKIYIILMSLKTRNISNTDTKISYIFKHWEHLCWSSKLQKSTYCQFAKWNGTS